MVLLRGAFSLIALLSLNGCLSTTSVGEHTFAQNYAGDPRRILVVEDMDNRPDAADVGFALKTGLQSCGLEAHVVEISEFALNAPARLRAAISILNPDIILTLQMTSGWIQLKGPVLQRYQLTATETTPHQEIWKGNVSWWANHLTDRKVV